MLFMDAPIAVLLSLNCLYKVMTYQNVSRHFVTLVSVDAEKGTSFSLGGAPVVRGFSGKRKAQNLYMIPPKCNLRHSREEFNRRDPHQPCKEHWVCGQIDMNLICSKKLCSCRTGMKWNNETAECQLFIDVDCPKVEGTTGNEEIDDALEFIGTRNIPQLTATDTMKDSGLSQMDVNITSKADLKNEFCREIWQIAERFEASKRPIVKGNSLHYILFYLPASDAI